MSAATLERRTSLGVILAGLTVWTVLLIWVSARFQGFDEAKYLGIGLNMLAGHGPFTVFGVFFGPHSPLWPTIMALPQAWFGLDAYAWAHVLGIVSSVAVMGIGSLFGWRIRPAVGALAVAGIVAFPYVFDLSRRVGLDMPVAALTLGYLLVGGIAVRRGSVRWGIATGLVFGIAFLVKESVLPVAPVPFLAAIAAARPGVGVARVAAWTMLAVVAVTAWWWWLFADETGQVYRLGTPAWTLLPLLVATLLAATIGLAWPSVVRRVAALPGSAWRTRAMERLAGPRLAWILALTWVVALSVFLSRTSELRGAGLIDAGLITAYAADWLDELRPVLAIGGIGAALELGARIVGRRRPGPPVDDLWLALVCSVPFVLLVVGIGELPRHYVAQMVLLLVVGSAGWIAVIEATVRRPTPARILVLAVAVVGAGLLLAPLLLGRPALVAVLLAMAAVLTLAGLVVAARRSRRTAIGRWVRAGGAVVLVVVVAFLGATGSLVASTAGMRSLSPLDAAKAAAVDSIVGWVEDELPPGSIVAFGALLSHEAAVGLGDDHRSVQIREDRDLVFDADAPLGVTRHGRAPVDDWLALSTSPTGARTFLGYEAGPLIDDLRRTGAAAWVQVQQTGVGDSLVVDAALTPAHGFQPAATWRYPTGAGSLIVTIYQVDPDRLAFDSTVWASEPALRRLVEQLEADGGPGARKAAAALLERVRLHPDDPGGPALLERLRVLAGG